MPRQDFTPQGTNLDLQPWQLHGEIYSDIENMIFRRGLAERASKGVDAFADGTLTEPPVYLVPSITASLNAWIYPTYDGADQFIYVTDGTTHKNITPTTPTAFLPPDPQTNAWTQGSISGLPVLNWQRQSGFWRRNFATPGEIELLAGAPECRAMRGHNNRLIAINTDDDSSANFPATEETVVWSSLPKTPGIPPADMPEADDWIPAVDNSAGDVQLSGGGPLVDGASLRSSFVVYGLNRTWIMDEVGGSFVFQVRKLSSTTGALTRNCIAPTPRGHVVLSGDDVYVNDGTNFQSIVNDRVKVDLFTRMGDNWFNSFVVHYAARGEVWVCIPTGTSIYPDRAYIWDTRNNMWGVRTLPKIPAAAVGPVPFPGAAATTWAGAVGSWAAQTRRWSQAVESSAIEGLILPDPAVDTAGSGRRFVAIDNLISGPNAQLFTTSKVSIQDHDFGEPDRLKIIRKIWPRMKTDPIDDISRGRVFVAVDVRDDLSNSLRQRVASASFSPGRTEPGKVDVFATGRYVSIEFSQSRSDGLDWEITGFMVEYELLGHY